MTAHRWTLAAVWLTVAGSTAWLAKIAVIVATDGRIITTGPAAWLMRIGLVGLFVGSTGVGLWVARRRSRPVRAAAVLLSPVALAASLVTLGMLASAAVRALVGGRGPAYLEQEVGIAVGAAVWLAVGTELLRRVRRTPDGTAGAW